MNTVREDLGSYKPASVPWDIQKARDATAAVLLFCKTHSRQEKLCREREGLEELHQKYPNAGFDGILRNEPRFHP